jgi:two-component system, LuxR family, sensor kinase FixL
LTPSSRPAAFLHSGNVLAISATAAVIYYVCAIIGLRLRLPPSTPSVLWPPNAALAALLLWVPPARWWSVLAGAAVAHGAVQLPIWSPDFVAAIFVTNCSEAVIAAALIRLFSDAPAQLDTLRRTAVFLICAGLTAPLVSSFLDAGVVTLFHGEDYWTVWRMRLTSNTLAELAVVPAVLGLLNCNHEAWRRPSRRWLDSAAISAGLVLVSLAIYLDAGQIGLARAPLAPFLPFLLWAAVRFGSAGVGLSALATVLLAVGSTFVGEGITQLIPPQDRIGLVQVFLLATTVPLLCVGALIEERQTADELKSSILAAIPSLVAVVSRDGRIVAVNEGWRRHTRDSAVGPGTPYFDLWRGVTDGSSDSIATGDRIRQVLDGSAPGLVLEYATDNQAGGQWWLLSVVPRKGTEGGAVITHTDMTIQKRAELEAQRSRDELAHATRVWVMGELTASLSHQLHQPLTSIIGNAQAGRRFIEAQPPNVAEVRHIFNDIAADAERAADVVRAVREMLRKDVAEYQPVDVNAVVRDTAALITGEAVIRSVSLQLVLEPSLPPVRGRTVQLRQVMLNLLVNAIEATAGQSGSEKNVIVRTASDAAGISVSVIDTGCGLPLGADDQIFEPLYTTKDSGMGMGLPIARAIVQAHGGSMSAGNGPDGGAVFQFTLPLPHERESGQPVESSVPGIASNQAVLP